MLGVKVRVGDPLSRVTPAARSSVATIEAGSLAVAIGLGIEAMRAVNLLPKDDRRRQAQRSRTTRSSSAAWSEPCS